MADKTPGQYIPDIFTIMADMQKEIADLSIAMTVLQLTLRDLIPDFDTHYKAHVGDAKVLEAKNEAERKIRVLHELARHTSKN